MDARQIALVQDTFAQVAPNADQVADLFYARLFQLDPALRSMFKGDMREQKSKLIMILKTVINGLTKLAALVPAVQALGRRHAAYQVEARHYDTVGAALIWTLRQGLGARFTPEAEAAWTTAYTLLAETMKAAAAETHEAVTVVSYRAVPIQNQPASH